MVLLRQSQCVVFSFTMASIGYAPWLFGLLVLLACPALSQIPTYVVQLDGSNFEHHTQATTGQTAGHWFVLFNSNLHHRRTAVSDLWRELAEDEEKPVIFAEVDMDDKANKALARQFDMVQPPEAVLFRDRKMYIYPKALTAEGAAADIQAFYNGDYSLTEAKTPPTKKLPPKRKTDNKEPSPYMKIGLGIFLLITGFVIRLKLAPQTVPGIENIQARMEKLKETKERRKAAAAKATADPLQPQAGSASTEGPKDK